MPRPPEEDGPQRFIRNWLTFDDRRPLRTQRMWKFAVAVTTLLVATALLAWFSGRVQP